MSTFELQQHIVEQNRDLPSQLLQEVADFVAFLKTKYGQHTDASFGVYR